MDERTFKSLIRVLREFGPDEAVDFSAQGHPEDHIWHDIERVQMWADKQKDNHPSTRES